MPIEQATDGTGTPLDPERYVADFAAALNEVVADPDRAAEMGRAGRQRAIDAFSWAAIAEQTVEIYRAQLGLADFTTPYSIIVSAIASTISSKLGAATPALPGCGWSRRRCGHQGR